MPETSTRSSYSTYPTAPRGRGTPGRRATGGTPAPRRPSRSSPGDASGARAARSRPGPCRPDRGRRPPRGPHVRVASERRTWRLRRGGELDAAERGPAGDPVGAGRAGQRARSTGSSRARDAGVSPSPRRTHPASPRSGRAAPGARRAAGPRRDRRPRSASARGQAPWARVGEPARWPRRGSGSRSRNQAASRDEKGRPDEERPRPRRGGEAQRAAVGPAAPCAPPLPVLVGQLAHLLRDDRRRGIGPDLDPVPRRTLAARKPVE